MDPCARNRGSTPTPWALVLAGGAGRRLAGLTSALHGWQVPKQFATLVGRRSLLQQTVGRIAPIFPTGRTLVVVGNGDGTLAREQLAHRPGIEVASQPRNLDTAAGILFGLARILARDRNATVAIFPSDHFVPRPAPLLRSLEEGRASIARGLARLVLLGVPADYPETAYGWIVPGRRPDPLEAPSLRSVSRFVEKPPADLARRLLEAGGLWNTLIMTGRARTLWRLAEEHLPRLAREFSEYANAVGGPDEEERLRVIYDRNEPASFSTALLTRAAGLGVIPVEGSGWSDWGSPDKVFRSLEGTAELAGLLERAGRGGFHQERETAAVR